MTPSTVWLTKNALSRGIEQCKVIRDSPGHPDSPNPEGALIVKYPGWGLGMYVEPKDYCLTKEEAILRAETLRHRRLVQLDAEIARLEGISFR